MSTTLVMNNKKYQVKFYNEKTGDLSSKGTFDTYEEAMDVRNVIEVDFYRKNTQFLPKGVSVGTKSFNLIINTFLITGKPNDHKLIASAKTIAEIRDLKMKCISSLIG